MCKLFIKEVLPGEITKGVGGCRTRKDGSQAGCDFKRSPDLALLGDLKYKLCLRFFYHLKAKELAFNSDQAVTDLSLQGWA